MTFWLLLLPMAFSAGAADGSAGLELEARLARMSLSQKVAQMLMVSFYGTRLAEVEADFLREMQPGAVALFGRNVESPAQLTALTNAMQTNATAAGGIPLLIAVDQEGGRIQHLQPGFTRFPIPMLWTATQNPELVYAVGRAMATEMRAVGVNMNLAPVADLNTNPRNPIIGRRSFGTEIERVAPILTAFIRGMQDNGVVAVVKHFPGHGDTDVDSHLALPVITHHRARLQAVELPPFIAAFDAGAEAVMVAHIAFSALDETLLPASLSEPVIEDLLRGELAYEGIVMTDALDMDAIDRTYSTSEAALRAIAAGSDLIAVGAHIGTAAIRTVIADVVAAVQSGILPEERIDASVRRILALKERYGLLDWEPLDPQTVDARLPLEAHQGLVEQLFEQGITLVGDAARIPLPADALLVYPGWHPRTAEQCRRPGKNLSYLGVSQYPSDEEIAWAATAGQRAAAVAVFTQDARSNPRQQRLVNALPAERTVVAALWDPSDVPVFPAVAAHLVAYSPLPAATAALCRVLLGELPALGWLPVRFTN